jgi:hypothetical protein
VLSATGRQIILEQRVKVSSTGDKRVQELFRSAVPRYDVARKLSRMSKRVIETPTAHRNLLHSLNLSADCSVRHVNCTTMLVLGLVEIKYRKYACGREPKRALRQVDTDAFPVSPMAVSRRCCP